MFNDYYSGRYICDTFYELRNTIKVSTATKRQQNHLLSLVEEAQTLANRMEDGLAFYKQLPNLMEDIEKAREKKKELKREIVQLELKKAGLKK